MKKLSLPLLAAAVIAGSAPAFAVPFTPTAQVLQDVKQLIADLEAIATHTTVDPSTIQQLETDLQLAVSGAVKPSLASVQKLATDVEAALADGKFTSSEELTIISDLDAVLVSAGFTSSEISTIQSQIYSIVTSSGITQADFQLVIGDLTALLADLQGTFVVTTQTISLEPVATPAAAAAESSASGDTATIITALRAAIGAEASVGITTNSLAAGTYMVSITKATDAAKVALGALVVTGTTGSANFGAGGQPLPAEFDATDIASVNIDDAASNPVRSGLTSQATSVRSGGFALNPNVAAPSVKGDVSFQTKVKANGPKSTFLLFAKKLPASAKLVLKINGASVGKVKTDAKGQLLITSGNVVFPTKADGVTPKTTITKLPAGVDISTAETLELDTKDGQVAATGGFTQS